MEGKIKEVEEVEKVSKTEPTYTKQNLLSSKKYANQKDLVNALLEDDKKYTLKEVDTILKNYLKGVGK